VKYIKWEILETKEVLTDPERDTKLFVQTATKSAKYLSSPLPESQFIVETATRSTRSSN